MKVILATFFLLFFTLGLSAQGLITLLHNGQASFFPGDQLDSAYFASVNGDSILLPGGEFISQNQPLIIDKEIHIIGVGHRPDSLSQIGNTRIIGSVELRENADNGSIESLMITGGIKVGENTYSAPYGRFQPIVDSYTFKRCFITGNFIVDSYDERNPGGSGLPRIYYYAEVPYLTMQECILIGDFTANKNCDGTQFVNCIFEGDITRPGNGVVFSHNIFFQKLSDLSSTEFENNIILTPNINSIQGPSAIWWYFTGQRFVFKNNLFVGPLTVIRFYTEHILVNNEFSQAASSIFQNFSGSGFDYNHDYHLQSTSPGYTLSTSGGPVGIYGGQLPYKSNTRPGMPSIISKQVSSRTDSLGRLPVRIRVKAQDY